MAKKRYNGRTKRAHIYLGGGLLGGAASLASNAISGGMSTGVGSAMQTLGGIASNIPGIGGIIGAGVNVLGGIVNKAFGSTINEEFVADTKASAQENAARKFDSSSAESVLQQQGDYQDMNLVSRDDVGKDGWFSDKAKNLAKSLNKQIKFSNDYNRGKIDMAFSNANEQEGLNLLSDYFGYGGPMMFKNGGGIHIKKANRGKFTEYCGGKVTSACIARGKHSSSPAVRKRATFAQNARGWKHADGGPLGRATSVGYLYDVENPDRRGISPIFNEAYLYDPNTLGAGVDTRYYGRGFKNRLKQGEGIPLDEIDERAYEAISDYDNRIMNEVSKYTSRPDTVSQSPRLYASQASYHHGPFGKKERAKLAKAIAEGDAKTQEEIIGGKAKGWGRRKQAIQSPYGIEVSFEDWKEALPSNLRNTDEGLYNLRGAYEGGLEPEWNNEDGSYHLGSRNPKTGEILKKPMHPTYLIGLMEDAREGYLPYRKDGKTYTDTWEGNKKAFGGSLVHGGDFTNGVTFIGNGGTHEQNPFEGVQMGTNPDGEPNLVEEGEVVYNDYVFSNRLKVPKKAKKDFKLKGETFADAAKALQKESEERPNDPISKRGLEASMGRLVGIQEEMRNKKNKGRKFADGGPFGLEQDFNLPNYTNQNRLAMSFLGDTPMAYMGSSGNVVTPEGGINTRVGTSQQEDNEEQDLAPTWMRYAPVAGSVGSVLSDMFGATNKPDYGPADYMNGAIQPVKPVGARTVSNYLTYKPLDTDYMTNKLNANRSAQRRAITNTSGGNRATAMAGLIASDYNYGNQLGDLTRQAAMYNDQQRQQVEAFNRGTNQYNAEALTKADMANANIQQQTNELRLKQRSAQAQMRDAANNRSSAARSANLTNLLDNLGAVGQENFMKNMISTNPALYYDLTGQGGVKYKGNGKKKKRGGRLTYGR